MQTPELIETFTESLPAPVTGAKISFRTRQNAGADFLAEVPAVDTGFVIGEWTFGELYNMAGLQAESRDALGDIKNMAIHPGGWQSWSAGWELMGREKLPRRVAVIPELIKLTNRDMENPPGKNWITGHFIVYLRVNDNFFCIASGEGDSLPPVSFYISRKKRRIRAEVYAPGKKWKAGKTIAKLGLFYAKGFFAFRDSLKKIYCQEDAFKTIDFLRESLDIDANNSASPKKNSVVRGKQNLPGGYESWYNHYTDINEKLILEDLEALSKTDNLLKLRYIEKKQPLIFQIDDGWERAVGEWEVNSERFPRGLKFLSEQITAKGYIPGLWLAPFIVTRKSRVFKERPEWLLRQTGPDRDKFVVAGFNHLWDKQYYCLDLSRKDVLDYIKALVERAIDEWGFRYIKLDFLYAGLFYGVFTNNGSPCEHYENACKILTERKTNKEGQPAAYLGCGVPFGPSYRYFPLSRTGADTREEWDWNLVRLLGHTGRPGALVNLRDTIGRTHLDNAVYLSDPDVIFLRTKNCKLNETEKELIALVNFTLAGQIMFSDDPLHLEEGDLALTRKINALCEKLENDEYGATRIGRDVFRVESRSGKITGIINLDKKPFRLKRETSPDLHNALSAKQIIVDHRTKISDNAVSFAPHSISLAEK